MPCQLQTIMCQHDTEVIPLPADIGVETDIVARKLDWLWRDLTSEMQAEAESAELMEEMGFFNNRFEREEYSSNASKRIAAGAAGAFTGRLTTKLLDLGFTRKNERVGQLVEMGLEALVKRAVSGMADAPGGRMQRVFEYENEERALKFEAFAGEADERGGTVYFRLTKSF